MNELQSLTQNQQLIGQMIKESRLKMGLSQLELAFKLGYDSPQQISLFERGLAKVPYATLGQLCGLIDLPERKIMQLLVTDFTEELKAQFKSAKKQSRQSGRSLKLSS